jgi:hypothetical protein
MPCPSELREVSRMTGSRWSAFWNQPVRMNVKQVFLIYTVAFILGAVAWAQRGWWQ